MKDFSRGDAFVFFGDLLGEHMVKSNMKFSESSKRVVVVFSGVDSLDDRVSEIFLKFVLSFVLRKK